MKNIIKIIILFITIFCSMPTVSTTNDVYSTEKTILSNTIQNTNRIETTRSVSYDYIDSFTDLSVMNSVGVDELNKIIDYWSVYSGDNPFINQGQVFIDASRETGLDPVYILAHAAVESAWGTSYYATTYHNYFGIGAFDYDPDNAINYSNDTLRDGIINGAKWIKENYYDNGQTTLFSMRYNYGYHEYCTSTTWIYSISDIIQSSYSLIL